MYTLFVLKAGVLQRVSPYGAEAGAEVGLGQVVGVERGVAAIRAKESAV